MLRLVIELLLLEIKSIIIIISIIIRIIIRISISPRI